MFKLSTTVVVRRVGNSNIFTVPHNLNVEVGEKFDVELDGDNIVYKPHKYRNIFETDDWMNYDYQKDLATDSELSELIPIGKEIID